MGFIEDVDEDGIVERHIQEVLRLEDAEARTLISRFKEARRELRDRLESIPPGTFSSQQVTGILAQVDGAIRAMEESLKTGIRKQAVLAGKRGAEHSLSEVRRFSKRFEGAVVSIDLDVVRVGLKAANFRLNQYDASIGAYSNAVRADIIRILSQATIEKTTNSEVIHRIGRFLQAEEWKLRRIVRTELHGLYNLGKQEALLEVRDEQLPDLKKRLFHPIDGRTGQDSKALDRINPIVDIDKPFIFTFKGDVRRFMTPPDRPNDRAVLIPFRKEWA